VIAITAPAGSGALDESITAAQPAATEGIMRALQSLKTLFGRVNHFLVRVCPAGVFENTVFARIHLLFVMLIIMGPVFGLVSWQSQKRVDDLLVRGTIAEATVTKATITRGKSTTYSIDMVWRDRQGAQRRLEGFTVSAGYYSRLTRMRPPAKLQIKYLPDETTSTRRTVAIDDHMRNSDGAGLMRVFLIMGLIGVPGTALMTFWRNHRLRRERAARLMAV
jgi:hypothetical protein